ncbi:hypothetical protein [Pimelobacter simplex]|uniref:hypothetical protein n=1 Tax=Nocardioides simplex TaxID=2045 RepID=UPI003AABA39D
MPALALPRSVSPRSARLIAAALAVPLLAPVLGACSHENDARDAAERRGPCPDVAASPVFAIDRSPDIGIDEISAALDDMMCDGEISEAEERCLRSPWARSLIAIDRDQYADAPEAAVRAAAGPATTITGTPVRRPRTARVLVELDGATGAYDVRRTARGWVAVAGHGCASGAAVEAWGDEAGEAGEVPDCAEAMQCAVVVVPDEGAEGDASD